MPSFPGETRQAWKAWHHLAATSGRNAGHDGQREAEENRRDPGGEFQ